MVVYVTTEYGSGNIEGNINEVFEQFVNFIEKLGGYRDNCYMTYHEKNICYFIYGHHVSWVIHDPSKVYYNFKEDENKKIKYMKKLKDKINRYHEYDDKCVEDTRPRKKQRIE